MMMIVSLYKFGSYNRSNVNHGLHNTTGVLRITFMNSQAKLNVRRDEIMSEVRTSQLKTVSVRYDCVPIVVDVKCR